MPSHQVTKWQRKALHSSHPSFLLVRCNAASSPRSEGSSAVEGWATLGWKSVSTMVLCNWFPFTGSLASHLFVGFRDFLLPEGEKTWQVKNLVKF